MTKTHDQEVFELCERQDLTEILEILGRVADLVKKLVQRALTQQGKPLGTAKSTSAPAATQKPPKQPAAPPASDSAPKTEQASQAAEAATAKTDESTQPAKDQMGALRQRFWATLKKASGATDDATARKVFNGLSGIDKVSDLSEGVLRSLGNALFDVSKGSNELSEGPNGPCIVEKATGEMLYPKMPPPAPVQAAAPADENMF